jgi:hypothetical protein
LLFLLAANLLSAEAQTAAKIVKCENLGVYDWVSLGRLKECVMNDKTSIDSDGYEISAKDETIQGLRMASNKKIEFLPENLVETFPNLIGYNARDCSIKQILRKKFRGLINLHGLFLSFNQIETIPSDAFKDLTALKYLELREINFKFFFDKY